MLYAPVYEKALFALMYQKPSKEEFLTSTSNLLKIIALACPAITV